MINILILSATASATNYIYTLKDRIDIKLFVTDASKFASGLYVDNVTPFLVPRAEDLDNYRDALNKIIEDQGIDILIPTSDYDMSGVMKITHSAELIDKYAKLADDDLWLRTATTYQKSKGSDKWDKIRY